MRSLWQDIRFGLRTLKQTPAFRLSSSSRSHWALALIRQCSAWSTAFSCARFPIRSQIVSPRFPSAITASSIIPASTPANLTSGGLTMSLSNISSQPQAVVSIFPAAASHCAFAHFEFPKTIFASWAWSPRSVGSFHRKKTASAARMLPSWLRPMEIAIRRRRGNLRQNQSHWIASRTPLSP